jgi:hypothetical protein
MPGDVEGYTVLLLTPKYFTSPRRHVSKNHWIEERAGCSAIAVVFLEPASQFEPEQFMENLNKA